MTAKSNLPTQFGPVEHLLVDLDGTVLGNRDLPLSIDFLARTLGHLRKYGGIRKAVRALIEINAIISGTLGQAKTGSENTLPPDSPAGERITNDRKLVEAFARRMEVPVDKARELLREGVSLIFPKLERHFFPMPGAKEFLYWAKDHYQLTLATNPVWPREIIELRVRWAGVDPAIFTQITDVRSMSATKPSNVYYREILEQQGLKPEQCLLIGNEVKMDLPATEVGIPVFIVGKLPAVTPLTHPKGKAPAWKGSFEHLKTMLEKSLAERAESSS